MPRSTFPGVVQRSLNLNDYTDALSNTHAIDQIAVMIPRMESYPKMPRYILSEGRMADDRYMLSEGGMADDRYMPNVLRYNEYSAMLPSL
jgi:hypothetical protein